MLTIKRTCAQKIMRSALVCSERPFIAVLPRQADDYIRVENRDQLQRVLISTPDAYVIYNQHPRALEWIEKWVTDPKQVLIEVCQETRGVLGLQARYRKNTVNETLELIDQ